MSFERWLNDYDKAFTDALANHSKYRGGLKWDKQRSMMLIPEGLEEKSIQLYTAYRVERTNKSLVWATWILAIATIILSIITLIVN